jgi:hypothetical protein
MMKVMGVVVRNGGVRNGGGAKWWWCKMVAEVASKGKPLFIYAHDMIHDTSLSMT